MRTTTKALLVFCGTLTVYPITPAAAALKANTPSRVCGFLADLGLPTSGWKHEYGDVFYCISWDRDLDAGWPLPNNLAFSADGNRSTVTQVQLVLNVNNRTAAKSAHSELLKAAEALSVKAAGQQLPQLLKKAIQDGKKGSAKVGLSTVEVIREDWPTGKGYEIRVTIK